MPSDVMKGPQKGTPLCLLLLRFIADSDTSSRRSFYFITCRTNVCYCINSSSSGDVVVVVCACVVVTVIARVMAVVVVEKVEGIEKQAAVAIVVVY